jgi:outer membrane receptor protein involved in Fe transport
MEAAIHTASCITIHTASSAAGWATPTVAAPAAAAAAAAATAAPPVATIDLLHARALAAARSPVRRSPTGAAQARQSLSAPSTVRTSRAAPRHVSRIARILNGRGPRSPRARDGAARDDDGLSSEDEAESADEQHEQIIISRA